MLLLDWYLQTDNFAEGELVFAKGTVFGHHRLRDDSRISTSVIQKIYILSDGSYVLQTKSGSCYNVGKDDIRLEKSDFTIKLMERFEILDGSHIEEKVKAETQKARERQEKRKEVLEELEETAKSNMDEDGLYLCISGMETLKAILKKGNAFREIAPHTHLSYSQDSILITDWNDGDVDFRYFPTGNMEPYHWSDGLENLYIHNIDDKSFDFCGSDRKIECKSGEVTKISHSEYRGEGLFSPDAVNGKSVFTKMSECKDSNDRI